MKTCFQFITLYYYYNYITLNPVSDNVSYTVSDSIANMYIVLYTYYLNKFLK